MSVSYKIEPEEHADILIARAQHTLRAGEAALPRPMIYLLVGGALFFSLLMELYRRFVLALAADLDAVPTFGMLMLQLLPLAIALSIGIWLFRRRMFLFRRDALAERFRKGTFVDIDIHDEGISWTSDNVNIRIDWQAVTSIHSSPSRIGFETPNLFVYIPARAFDSQSSFASEAVAVEKLWQAARKGAADTPGSHKKPD